MSDLPSIKQDIDAALVLLRRAERAADAIYRDQDQIHLTPRDQRTCEWVSWSIRQIIQDLDVMMHHSNVYFMFDQARMVATVPAGEVAR